MFIYDIITTNPSGVNVDNPIFTGFSIGLNASFWFLIGGLLGRYIKSTLIAVIIWFIEQMFAGVVMVAIIFFYPYI